MPEIEIRPAKEEHIEALININHSYSSDHVWQMDQQYVSGNIGAAFREVRLPRIAKVEYPRPTKAFKNNWDSYSGVLVAIHTDQPVGYTSLVENMIPTSTLMLDLVVVPNLRRQGIGSALTLAALDWVKAQTKSHRLVLGMQTKNFPAINLAQRLGFDYCGYIDNYYPNRDIAIFFTKWII